MREWQSSLLHSLLVLYLVLLSTSVGAAEFGYGGFGNRDRGLFEESPNQPSYALSVAGGVAAPSSSGLLGENPAGLIYNQHPSMLGYVATGRDRPDLLSDGLSFLAGNGLAAATIGVQSFSNATDSGGSITNFNFGAATFSDLLNTSFGLSGSYRFTNHANAVDPSLQSTWTADFGLVYNPFGTIQVGAKLYDLSQGVSAGAVGFATHINNYSLLAVDASTNNHGQGLTVKPGIGVRAAALSVTYGYGMQVDKNALSGITPGNTLGLGYDFSPQFRLQGYYNQFSTYFLGGTIGLF